MKKSALNKKSGFWVVGIDPGLSGAIVITDGKNLEHWPMPIKTNGKDRLVDFDQVLVVLQTIINKYGDVHVYLEKAVPMAMGSKSAFQYGKGVAALEIAILILQVKHTQVEPQKWAKEMHEGISADLRPKAKSLIAVERLYPKLYALLPKSSKGKVLEGPMDALLIAAYGLRKNGFNVTQEPLDFF